MRTHRSLSRQVVELDWRLLIGACRRHGSDLVVPILLAAVLFAAFCESALATASVIAGRGEDLAATVLAAYVWNACLAAAALAMAVGAHSTAERIAHHLLPEPVTRWQVYTALVALSIAGRHALVSGVALVPVLLLLQGLFDPLRVAGAGIAVVLVLRLVSGVTRSLAVLAGTLGALRLVPLGGALGVLAYVVNPGLETAVAALPPSLVVRLAAGTGSPLPVWLGLAAWTVAVGLLEYVVLLRRHEAPTPGRSAARLPAIPAWTSGLATLARVAPALLYGELVRLVRWRRFLLGWGVYFAAVAAVLARGTLIDARLLPALLVALAPPLVAVGTLGNLFGPDRAGAQAFFLALDDPAAAIRAKVAAIALVVASAEVVTFFLFVAFVPRPWQLADAYIAGMAIAFCLWTISAGRIASTVFPTSSDPRALGGGLLKGPAAALLVPLDGLALAGMVAPAFWFDTGRIGLAALLCTGCGIIILVAGVSLLASRMSARALSARREQFIATLGLGSSMA
jgi:hypothetical protein